MEEMKIKNKGMLTFVDVSDVSAQYYRQLVIYKSYMSTLGDINKHLEPDFSGNILIDTLFANGNNSDRFIECRVENGKLARDSFAVVSVNRRDELRVLSNRIICQDPDGMKAGVLLSHQKKMILKGISI